MLRTHSICNIEEASGGVSNKATTKHLCLRPIDRDMLKCWLRRSTARSGQKRPARTLLALDAAGTGKPLPISRRTVDRRVLTCVHVRASRCARELEVPADGSVRKQAPARPARQSPHGRAVPRAAELGVRTFARAASGFAVVRYRIRE